MHLKCLVNTFHVLVKGGVHPGASFEQFQTFSHTQKCDVHLHK